MTVYLIKTVLCSALFWALYRVLLEKERMHAFNRAYLLSSLVLSFVLPALRFTVEIPAEVEAGPLFGPQATDTAPSAGVGAPADGIPAVQYLTGIVYAAVTLVLLGRLAAGVGRFLKKGAGPGAGDFEGAKLIQADEGTAPHSFLNYIFVPRGKPLDQEILYHELAHVRQRHSLDKLLLGTVQAFCWFNPVLPLYRKALDLTHEYLADEAVLNRFGNVAHYRNLLIDRAGNTGYTGIGHPFHFSTIKKRLTMMTRKTPRGKALLIQWAAVPLSVLVTGAVFCNKVTARTTPAGQPQETAAPQPQPRGKAVRPDAVPAGQGVSQELLDEYAALYEKCRHDKDSIRIYYPHLLTQEDLERMKTIYTAMSKEQQSQQRYRFRYRPLMEEKPVTEEVFESWKDPQQYGVWVDGTRVANSDLGKYKNTDFGDFVSSRLLPNARDYGKYRFQVDAYTKAYIRRHNEEARVDRRLYPYSQSGPQPAQK